MISAAALEAAVQRWVTSSHQSRPVTFESNSRKKDLISAAFSPDFGKINYACIQVAMSKLDNLGSLAIGLKLYC